MKIEQIGSACTGEKDARVSIHSHIKGLGLNEDGSPNRESNGFVGQLEAREVF